MSRVVNEVREAIVAKITSAEKVEEVPEEAEVIDEKVETISKKKKK